MTPNQFKLDGKEGLGGSQIIFPITARGVKCAVGYGDLRSMITSSEGFLMK